MSCDTVRRQWHTYKSPTQRLIFDTVWQTTQKHLSQWFVDCGFFLDPECYILVNLPLEHQDVILDTCGPHDWDAVLKTLGYLDIETIPLELLDLVAAAKTKKDEDGEFHRDKVRPITLPEHAGKLQRHVQGVLQALEHKNKAQCINDGYVECLKYILGMSDDFAMVQLLEEDSLLNEHVFAYAVRRNDMELVRYLYQRKCPMGETAFLEACSQGNMDIVKFLVHKNCPVHEDAMMQAALKGHRGVVEYLLRDMSWKQDHRVCVAASRNGYLHILDLLASTHRYPLGQDVFGMAILRGHGHIVDYLLDHNAPLDKDFFQMAAWSGNLELVTRLYSHKCAWDENTMCAAAHHDFDNIVKFLHENGCPWDKYSIFCIAMANNCKRVLAYLETHTCPSCLWW